MRTIVYVDGFNLYYGQLKGTPYKWLDPQILFGNVLASVNQIIAVKYFTARVQPTPTDPAVHVRQDAYFQALGLCCPLVELHFGHFLRHKVRMGNANPPPATVEVWKSEEKGSDVNLALHVLNDAWQDAYDCAVIVSNDSDLCEAMGLVKQHHPQKVLGLITPGAPKRKTSQQLASHADFRRPIRQHALQNSQLPTSIPLLGPLAGTVISKPETW
jgi:uncharacterized LabA/DUF88 family protein